MSQAPASSPAEKSKKKKGKAKPEASLAKDLTDLKKAFDKRYTSVEGQFIRKVAAAFFFFMCYSRGDAFIKYCDQMSHALSNPSIMFKVSHTWHVASLQF